MKKHLSYAIAIVCIFSLIFASVSCAEQAIDIPEPEYKGGLFYYNALSAKQQDLYMAVKLAADNFELTSEVIPHAYTTNEWQETYNALIADNPLIFYLDVTACHLSISETSSVATIGYIDTIDGVNEMRTKYLGKINEIYDILDLDNDELDDFAKELLIHDWLVGNVTYLVDENSDQAKYANTSYGAIVEGTALCDGYSYAFKQLCDMSGIECSVVYGIGNSRPHAWNLLKIGGQYTYTDLTWDDPDVDFISNFVFHGYFNLSYDEISRDHVFDQLSILPETTNEYNYYIINNLYAQTEEEFAQLVYENTIRITDEGKDVFEFKTILSDEKIKSIIEDALSKVSQVKKGLLKPQFRIINASYVNHAFAVQIFYAE